ncbi:MAG: cytochrome b/b6 domain-containing protein [Rhodospirillales bacterium]|nr:cytochrome b/b6 domain-containing protein [Rhodospirillales bacterium]MCB9980452.1 cytochrome b/b6 domain-containing protein [Rhodospirillales bacterium]
MTDKYPKNIRVLHWTIAFLIALQIALGFLMEDMKSLFLFHVIVGIGILTIGLLRLALRQKQKNAFPGRPEKISPAQWKAAKIGQNLLYALLILTPIAGIGALFTEEPFEDLHVALVYLFMATIAGHVLMVFKHLYVDKENLLKLMK